MRRRRTTGSPPRFFDSLFIVGRVSEGVGEPVWVRKGVSPGSPVRGEQFERSEQTNHDCTTQWIFDNRACNTRRGSQVRLRLQIFETSFQISDQRRRDELPLSLSSNGRTTEMDLIPYVLCKQ